MDREMDGEFTALIELQSGVVMRRQALAAGFDPHDIRRLVRRRGLTVRLGWGQVMARACETAPRIGALLQQRGWGGRSHSCPNCPDTRWPQLRVTR